MMHGASDGIFLINEDHCNTFENTVSINDPDIHLYTSTTRTTTPETGCTITHSEDYTCE